ncbi:PP2C family protein-serine/threonine phosphatase [Acidicapsa dinghuensis]|uniref:PP2C family protein-serine/threonine phosphatase n=1 Tax=Acidicapsa dinghuensis TaxID=2218256 RepID=A0ABW1EAB8_9BACT|nr:SpoIIE family protein phosphatase [Acidicapsa dinghuensis]
MVIIAAMPRPSSLLGAERAIVRADASDPDLRIFKTNIFVHDQDRSLDFYVNQLGFDLLADARFTNNTRWIAVAPPNGSAILALLCGTPGSAEEKLIGRETQLAFITEDIHGTYDRWRARGVRFTQPPTSIGWGGTLARFEDIDGNHFELMTSAHLNQEIEGVRREQQTKLEAERRAAQELEIARDVQARLFPQARPQLETLEYAGLCLQARHVGGDYFDYLSLGGGRVGLVVGDVSGKGIAAALLMANLQANVRSQCAGGGCDPAGMLRRVNDLFYASSAQSSYATLFFGEYDDCSRRLRYANCGHLPGMVLRADGGVEMLEATCTLVGLFAEWDCFIGECQLNAGDTLLLYTDGVTEAFSGDEEFGQQRLLDALCRSRGKTAIETIEAIADEVRRFNPGEQSDDITLIAAQVKDTAAESAGTAEQASA